MTVHLACALVFGALAFLAALFVGYGDSELELAGDWVVALTIGGMGFIGGGIASHAMAWVFRWILREQRRAAVCALFLFAAMGLCPPWVYTFSAPGAATALKPAGYHLIFAPPAPEEEYKLAGVRIDIGRLLIQWAALATIVGAVVIWRSRPPPAKSDELVLDAPAGPEGARSPPCDPARRRGCWSRQTYGSQARGPKCTLVIAM